MATRRIHICLEQVDAPAHDAKFPDGSRWVCSCGSHFVYREGLNRAGYPEMEWWEAPPVAIPRQRARSSLRARLTHPWR